MSQEKKLYTNIEVDKKENATVEIKGEIPEESLVPYRAKAIKKLGEEVSIDGFRKGHVPEAVLIKHLGEVKILHESVDYAFGDIYPLIITEHELAPITHPQISLTKLVPGNPVGFTITIATMPEVTLPDYKAIGKEVSLQDEDIAVTDEDVDAVIKQVQAQRAALEKQEEGTDKKEGEESAEEKKEENLPPLTDEFVAQLGDFKTVEEFKTQLRENIKKEKEMKARDKKRLDLTEKLVAGATITLPEVLIEQELHKMIAQFKDNVAQLNVPFEDYLQKINKTEADMRSEWRPDAEKRAKLQLILAEIADKEELKPEEERIEKEVAHLVEHYKEADPNHARAYIISALRNEMVFEMLEKKD